MDRGNQAVVHSVAGNSGAKFSENGFAALLKAAETDDKLAEKTGSRLDLPLRAVPAAFVTSDRGGSIPVAFLHASRISGGGASSPERCSGGG